MHTKENANNSTKLKFDMFVKDFIMTTSTLREGTEFLVLIRQIRQKHASK